MSWPSGHVSTRSLRTFNSSKTCRRYQMQISVGNFRKAKRLHRPVGTSSCVVNGLCRWSEEPFRNGTVAICGRGRHELAPTFTCAVQALPYLHTDMFPCSEFCGAVPGLKLDTLKWERVWSMKPCMVPVWLNMYWYTRRGMKSDVKEITKA